jgi:hypothetical protein
MLFSIAVISLNVTKKELCLIKVFFLAQIETETYGESDKSFKNVLINIEKKKSIISSDYFVIKTLLKLFIFDDYKNFLNNKKEQFI